MAKKHFELGEKLYQISKYAEALVEFEKAHKLSGLSGLLFNIARCHEVMAHLHEAIEYYQKYLKLNPNSPSRSLVETRIVSLKQRLDEQKRDQEQKQKAADRTPGALAVSPEPAADVDPPAGGRSTFWLTSGIGAGALAVGFEIMAWVSYARGNELLKNDPDLDTYRSLTIAGHVLAGAFAVASGLSFYFYFRSGKKSEPPSAARLMIMPGPGRMVLGGSIAF